MYTSFVRIARTAEKAQPRGSRRVAGGVVGTGRGDSRVRQPLGDGPNARATRTDSLYLTVTIFATLGLGDISAKVETARLVVTAQMLLDLVVLGLGIQVILGAVKRGKANADTETV